MSLCNSMTYIKGTYSHTKEDSKTSKYRTGIGLISTTSRVPTIFFSLPYFVVSFKLIYRWKYFGFECPYGVKPQADSLLLLKIKTYQPCKKKSYHWFLCQRLYYHNHRIFTFISFACYWNNQTKYELTWSKP